MNILHLNMNYYNSKIHHNIVKSLNNISRVDGIIFYPDYTKNLLNSNFNNNDEWEDKYIKKVYCLNKLDRFLFYSRANKLHKKILDNVKLDSYHHVLAHSLYSNGLLALKLKETHGINYSVIITNTDINKYMKFMPHLKKTALEIMNKADNVIFSSPAYQERVLKMVDKHKSFHEISKKSSVIPFGIDDFWLENKMNSTKKIEIELENRPLQILYVGKINKNKNIESTLDALVSLNDKFSKGIEFNIVGEPDGVEGQRILTRLKKSNLVKYQGYADGTDLLKKYRSSDIFIMTSLTESFGLVYPEAMSQGLPLIYSKGEGFDQHFKDGSIGYGVKATESKEIADAVLKILANYNEISCCSFIKASHFDWDTIAHSFIKKMENK
ncbi:glycosyltransferase family 4 protein [Exiguobacterium sp. SH3S1]|uniref:glycosyltransferase family 4 protein n=1 Tax=Exiguobacterium sp. SH3S1 TaxID=2510955 RepID=UPI00103FC764|nr:glycosyltransferase family 4 protein [Exiguobacterium sp. SH3S1]TCI58787.1 glycosyltransferase [Exiguobacterium sp. SH3S1]